MEALLLIGGFVLCGILGYAAAGLAERFRREINGENPRILPGRRERRKPLPFSVFRATIQKNLIKNRRQQP